MKYYIKNGKEKGPAIAIVCCLHGTELVGEYLFNILKRISLDKGKLLVLLANEKALKIKLRSYKYDLNRTFGKKSLPANALYEYDLAKKILKSISSYQYVVDIHGMNSDLKDLIIITKKNKRNINLLKKIPTNNILHVPHTGYGKYGLISNVKSGISIEYGRRHGKFSKKVVLQHFKNFLINIGAINGEKSILPSQNLYELIEELYVPYGYELQKNITPLSLVKKGTIIAHKGHKDIVTKKDSRPVFFYKKKYKKQNLLMASEKKYII